MTDIGERIKARRLDLGLSQENLAWKAGVTAATLRRSENGKTAPDVDTLRKIAAALGCTVGALIDDDQPDPAPA